MFTIVWILINHCGNQPWNPTFPFILARGTNEYNEYKFSGSDQMKMNIQFSVVSISKKILICWIAFNVIFKSYFIFQSFVLFYQFLFYPSQVVSYLCCHVTACSIHQEEKIVNFFAQDTCNDDIMTSLHKHKMVVPGSMLGYEIN